MHKLFLNNAKSNVTDNKFATKSNKKLPNLIKYSAGDAGTNRESDSKEMTLLRKKISEVETNYKNLLLENKKSNIELLHERHRVSQLERKLQFVKDNHDTLRKLKEAYINMKFNELTSTRDTKIAGIQDRSVQTTDDFLRCKCFSENEDVSDQLKPVIPVGDYLLITRTEMERLTKTTAALKEAIAKWGNSRHHHHNFTYNNSEIKEEDSKLNTHFVIQ